MRPSKLSRPKDHARVFFTLRIATIERLKKQVKRGSWSWVADQAINAYLDKNL